jgi:hypothetical protein
MTLPPLAVVAIIAAVVGLVGTLFTILFNRVAHLERRVDHAENLVTKLRMWAVKTSARYYAYRKDGAPDLDEIPGLDE